jgi:hypothetical protein
MKQAEHVFAENGLKTKYNLRWWNISLIILIPCKAYIIYICGQTSHKKQLTVKISLLYKGNNKIIELRTILQRESQNS